MPIQTRSRRLAQSPHDKRTFKIVQYLSMTMESVYEAYIEKDCRLDSGQIARLGNHKYSSVDASILDEIVMHKVWNWVVQLYPYWLAPNLITLIGLIVNLVTVLVLSHFCYTATEEAPWWAYVQAALGLFIYQTLDATDGKQARRTNSSSPLGELFDHGCDSMTQVFVTLNLCYAMQLGLHRNFVFATVVISVAMFYIAHWSTYCTGYLKFSRFDVTEAQIVIIVILLLTAAFGPGFWSATLFKVNLKFIFIGASMLGMANQFFSYMKSIFSEGSGKNGSTVADTSIVFPLFPLLSVCLPFCMIYSKSVSGVYDDNITLFCLCFAAVGAKATNRLVIAHMSQSELTIWDWIYLSPIMMIINQYYDFYFDEYKVLLIATIYAYVSLLIFCVSVCQQFCDYLNIYCFRIKDASTDQQPSTSGLNARRVDSSGKRK
ncbi:hypothetical protein M3Y99_00331300 [Aphelenchoides fujianensis]|nr:hypothetical protein M3Y99_00331300 [Aphelenchoides fujianensis]